MFELLRKFPAQNVGSRCWFCVRWRGPWSLTPWNPPLCRRAVRTESPPCEVRRVSWSRGPWVAPAHGGYSSAGSLLGLSSQPGQLMITFPGASFSCSNPWASCVFSFVMEGPASETHSALRSEATELTQVPVHPACFHSRPLYISFPHTTPNSLSNEYQLQHQKWG